MKRHLICLLSLLSLLAITPSVSGCVCEKEPTVTEAFKQADAIFSAKFVGAAYSTNFGDLLELMKLSPESAEPPNAEAMKELKLGNEVSVLALRFEVTYWWKGDPINEVVLTAERKIGPDGKEIIPDCEYPFKLGENYLVYAYEGKHGLETSVCTKTKMLSVCTKTKTLKQAEEDLKALRKIKKG